MNENKTNRTGKKLIDFLKGIDSSLEFRRVLGEGGNGIVFHMHDGHKDVRLKIAKSDPKSGCCAPLGYEYQKIGDLAKTTAALEPIKIYEGSPSIHIDKESNPYRCNCGPIGSNAYQTEFIEGDILDQAGRTSEVALDTKLKNLLDRIHQAGYEFEDGSDFNANNILAGQDGKLYLIDPMFLTLRKKQRSEKGITTEELNRVSTITAMYSSK